jgi:adenosylcobinamide kinase/adenosylcobinamide-phosphate guanylyltransferase
MESTTFVIGGCRSGKSSHALRLGEAFPGRRKIFVATCVPQDSEMRQRVQRHQQDRGPQWSTLEVPVELAESIAQQGANADLILIDCLTLWVSNMMLAHEDQKPIDARVERLCTLLRNPPCPVILVSNEVGGGIVPENALARRFRDIVGWTNQQVAAACNQVIWMVAGLPVPIKPMAMNPGMDKQGN